MKRPPVRAGVGKPPTPGSGASKKSDAKPASPSTSAKPAPKPASQRDSGKILASVTDLTKLREARAAKSTAKPARAEKAGRNDKPTRQTKSTKQINPRKARKNSVAGAAASNAIASGRRIFERLSPEAARFRAYSRRRRAILLSVISSFTALVLLMLASMYTPMLAVETIRITGTDRLKVAELQAALKSQLGTPLPMVSSDKIAEELKPFALIESYSITSRPPHSLVIRITERSPIAIVSVGGTEYLYDPAGVKIGKASSSDEYPTININGDPASSAEYALAIDVLLALPASLLPRVYSIDAKTKDNVTMELRGNAGQRIVWGDSSRSALKSKVLAALIRNYKKSDRVTFDVSSPTAPVVRY
jgi:cell division protein FtsQ